MAVSRTGSYHPAASEANMAIQCGRAESPFRPQFSLQPWEMPFVPDDRFQWQVRTEERRVGRAQSAVTYYLSE